MVCGRSLLLRGRVVCLLVLQWLYSFAALDLFPQLTPVLFEREERINCGWVGKFINQMQGTGVRRRLVAAEITFPCDFDISESPYSFCDQLEKTKATLDAGFEQEMIGEIARLKAIRKQGQFGIGNSAVDSGEVLDFLYQKLHKHFPQKYNKPTIAYSKRTTMIGMPTPPVSLPGPRRRNSSYAVLAFILLIIALVAVFLIWMHV